MLRKRGFTLLELLIVISVIAILVGIALPRFRGIQEEGLIAQAKGELRTLQTAVESYYIHNTNTYPAVITGTTLTDQIPQIVSILPTDPFNPGADYGYNRGGTNDQYYVIYSIGIGGDGSAIITGNAVVETVGASCIFVSNAGRDTTP